MITGDDDFGRREVWPVLRDVARWVCARGSWVRSPRNSKSAHTLQLMFYRHLKLQEALQLIQCT